MTEDQFANIDSLSETVKSIQYCLQCTICLEMMSSPVKTRCGHTFCRTCIATVLNKKNSKCPLCNTSLQRRSISKDKHTGMCINSFERLVRAIREDTNIDILSHTKNPRNTREGYPTPKVSQRSTNDTGSKKKGSEKISSFFTKKTPGEQSAGPSNRDILDGTSASCSEYKKDNAIKKDDSAERRNGRKESSSDGLSGVYPLLCSPRKNQNANDEVISEKEERIENWLETLPDTVFLENPLAASDQEQNCLDDTITVISEFSSVSCEKINIKKENDECSTVERLMERDSAKESISDSIKEQRFSKEFSRGGNNTRGKNKRTTRSFLEKKIKRDSTERKLKYEMTHAKVRERCMAEKSAKTSGDSLISTTDAADSSKHLAEPGNATRETWNTVVQFGKEMRTKRNKLKSLDVSVQSTGNSRLSDEYVANRTAKNRKLSSTNLQIRSRIVDGGQNDSIEKQNESGPRCFNESGQRLSPAENQTSFDSRQEQKMQQNTSFISLDEGGRVPITSLRRDQMNDIIGITIEDKDTDIQESTENLAEDHGTVPKKRLSLRKRNECSKNCDRSPARLTPIKVNLEERYELLRGSPPLLSPKNAENTPGRSDGDSWKTESISKLSLKKRSPNNEKANKVPISRDVSQLSSVKCNLMEQMNRSEVKRREGVGNAETTSKIDQERRKDAREVKKLECDTRTNIATTPSTEKTHVVPFSKLGKVFRKRRKVKFYKLGSLRRESATCTLSTTISNASRVNVITLLASDDTLETSKMFEEECNLENGTSGSSINRIDVVDKKNDEVKATKYLSQSQDSLGVLLVSLKDEVPGNKRNDDSGPLRDISEIQQRNKVDFGKSSKKAGNVSLNRNEIRIPEQKEAHSKPVIISVVRMMSPEKDSQLKFLHLDSPSNTIPERMLVQRMKKSKRNSVQKIPANFSDRSDIESSDSKKRKRSSDIAERIVTDKVYERIAKNDIRVSSSENESDYGEPSKNVTHIEKLNENVNKRAKAKSTMDGNVISLSSDEDNAKRTEMEDARNELRKPYKRIIVPTSGSDTDPGTSTKRMNVIDERKKDNNVSTVKRKRVSSVDSDSDTIVNEIMTNWCNGLVTSQRSSKKGKLEETRITKAASSRASVQPPESLEFDSWNNCLTPVKRAPEKELQDRSNNDIIDKVRLIRMNDNVESKSRKEEDAIDDNFDEAMAEVMTHSLGTNFFSSENVNVNSRETDKGSSGNKNEENRVPLTSSYVETNDLFAETNRSKVEENSKDFDKTLIENLNESNKENNVKEENSRYLRNNGQRDTSNGTVRLTNERKIDKPFEGRSTSMSDGRKYKESKNQNEIEEAMHDYEYDSLMNVTQDQLLLKALEEDLFGPANSRGLAKSTAAKTSSPERRLERESRTPRKIGKRNLGNKDAESSSDENDIIENTPQSQKKFMEVDHSIESRARKSLNVSQATPVSRKNFKATTTTTTMTPSTIVGKLKTPIDQNKIRPLYQSTPKIIQATSNREKEASKFVEENKKALESITDSRNRSMMQVKDESTRNANRSADKRQLCFVWSSLAAPQIESIKKLAVLYGASCTHNFIPAVTHVIVSTKEENNAATKTLKFLQGIAYRKFVVGFKWVVDCLKEGRLLDEESYEAVDCYTLEPGPRKSRLRQSNLFNGFAFLCVEPFPNITVTQCQDLLKGVGATIVESIGALASVKNMYKVILLQNEVHRDEVVADWYKKTSAVPVSCDWIVECISQYRLVSCYMYLHEIVPEDILKSGYPEEMIDPEEFNSTCETSAGH